MKIVEIAKNEFNQLTVNHPLANFEQTSNWADLKRFTGWKSFFIGYQQDDGQYLAYAMFLAKKMPLFNAYLFYAPHGFLIDYQNQELLKAFNRDLIDYLKKQNAFEVIIDPYLSYQQRDINGDVVVDGYENKKVVSDLIQMGYRHTGLNLYYENLQPRFLFRLNIKDQTYEELFKNFRYEARRRAKRKDFLAISIKELDRSQIVVYKKLMQDTAKRRGFIDRSLAYYEQMYDAMHDDGILHYYVAEIDFEKCQANILKEIAKSKAKIAKIESRSNSKHNENVKNEELIVLNANEELLKVVETAMAEHGKNVALSGVTLITYAKEAIMLLAGNDEKYLQHFMTSNIIVSELIKKAKEDGYDYYNFYGITGDFDPKNEHYGLYAYKRQYGGEVVELVGQFEYTISPLMKRIYNLAKKAYNFTKSVKK